MGRREKGEGSREKGAGSREQGAGRVEVNGRALFIRFHYYQLRCSTVDHPFPPITIHNQPSTINNVKR